MVNYKKNILWMLPAALILLSSNAGATSTSQNAEPQGTVTTNESADKRLTFVLRGIDLKGVTAFDAQLLTAAYAEQLNHEVTFTDLETIARRITSLYRANGYFLAQAIVPLQVVKQGVVEISVIEGQLGEVRINIAPNSPITEQRIRDMLASLVPGKPINGPRYEHVMLLLSDVPGIRVRSTLMQGERPGTSDLVVAIEPTSRFLPTVEGDNYGDRITGRVQIGGAVRVASPTKIGDNIDAKLMVSQGSKLTFGRVSYEAPIGSNGARGGVGISRMAYQLGEEFSVLDAHGIATIYDASLIFPFIRQRNENLFLRLVINDKKLSNDLRAAEVSFDKRISGAGLGWSYEKRDQLFGEGYWNTNGLVYSGHLSLLDALSKDADRGPSGPMTSGSFTKFDVQGSRLQALSSKSSLFTTLALQWTDSNLDPSEKFSLGGPQAVRAYPSGEGLVDQGAIINLEWRYSINENLTSYGFYDMAHGRRSHMQTAVEDNYVNLRGPGIGVNWSKSNNFAMSTTVAWRKSGPAVTDNNKAGAMFSWRLQKSF